ncbi:MAG: hypothetical protein CMB80_09435 [Flammeovirgaceae bacterium]|nr:hypothetical protein [Flammeovirgaceae bacterium]
MSDLHGLAAICLQLYKDKVVEVNTGEQKTTLRMADFDTVQKDLIRGVLKDAVGDALVLECDVGREKKQIVVNCWSIISIAEVGTIKCAYVDEDFRKNRRAH